MHANKIWMSISCYQEGVYDMSTILKRHDVCPGFINSWTCLWWERRVKKNPLPALTISESPFDGYSLNVIRSGKNWRQQQVRQKSPAQLPDRQLGVCKIGQCSWYWLNCQARYLPLASTSAHTHDIYLYTWAREQERAVGRRAGALAHYLFHATRKHFAAQLEASVTAAPIVQNSPASQFQEQFPPLWIALNIDFWGFLTDNATRMKQLAGHLRFNNTHTPFFVIVKI